MKLTTEMDYPMPGAAKFRQAKTDGEAIEAAVAVLKRLGISPTDTNALQQALSRIDQAIEGAKTVKVEEV